MPKNILTPNKKGDLLRGLTAGITGEESPPEGAETFSKIDNAGEFADWAQYNVGKLAPTIAATVATGGIGGFLAKSTAKAGLKYLAKKGAEPVIKKAAGKELGKRALKGKVAGGVLGGALQLGSKEPEPLTPRLPGEEPEEDTSILGEGVKSTVRGIGQLASGVPWLAGQVTRPLPGDAVSDTLLEFSAGVDDWFQKSFPKGKEAKKQLFTHDKNTGIHINEALFLNPEWLAGNLPEVAVSLYGSIRSGVSGAKLASDLFKNADDVARKRIIKTGGLIGGGVAGGALEGAGDYAQKRQEGYSIQDSANASGLFGIATGLLGAISVDKFLNPKAKSKLMQVAINGLTEGGTEFLESPAGAVIDKVLLGEEIDWGETTAAGLNEGVLALMMGGGATAFTGDMRDASQDKEAAAVYGDVRQEPTPAQSLPTDEGGRRIYDTQPQEERRTGEERRENPYDRRNRLIDELTVVAEEMQADIAERKAGRRFDDTKAMTDIDKKTFEKDEIDNLMDKILEVETLDSIDETDETGKVIDFAQKKKIKGLEKFYEKMQGEMAERIEKRKAQIDATDYKYKVGSIYAGSNGVNYKIVGNTLHRTGGRKGVEEPAYKAMSADGTEFITMIESKMKPESFFTGPTKIEDDTPLESRAPGLYSGTLKAAQNLTQETGDAIQLVNTLKKQAGVKKEELDFIGVEEWAEGRGKTTKQELVNFIEQGGIQIEEVEKGGKTGEQNWRSALENGKTQLRSLGIEVSSTDDGYYSGFKSTSSFPEYRAEDGEKLSYSFLPNDEGSGLTNEDTTINEENFADFIETNELQGNEQVARNFVQTSVDKMRTDAMGGYEDTSGPQYADPNLNIPGGKNYTELLLKLPEVTAPTAEFPADREVRETILGTGRRAFYVSGPEGDTFGSHTYTDVNSIQEAKDKFVASFAQPIADAKVNFQSTHYEESNILAHVRFDERIDTNGKKTLFIQEIQSDLHQRGRKEGYETGQHGADWQAKEVGTKGTENHGWEVFDGRGKFIQAFAAESANAALEKAKLYRPSEKVPDAPLKKSWPALVLKRMIRYGAEKGFDQVAWTTGEMQADRYDLSRQVSLIDVGEKGTDQGGDYVDLTITDITGNSVDLKHAGGIPMATDWEYRFYADKLEDAVGKGLAEKILEGDQYTSYKGEDLKVGGEKLKSFYDKELVYEANKLLKKYGKGARVKSAKILTVDLEETGGAVEDILDIDIAGAEKPFREVPAFDINADLMVQAVGEGFPLTSIGQASTEQEIQQVYAELEGFFKPSPTKRMFNSGLVTIVPFGQFEQQTGRSPFNTQGVFKGGKLYIHTKTKNPVAVLLHEGTHSRVIGEKDTGLELLLGNSYDALQKQFDRLLAGGDNLATAAARRAQIGVTVQRLNGIKDEELLNNIERQERLAYYTEDAHAKGANVPLFNRIMAKIKAFFSASTIGRKLAKLGISPNLDEAMIIELSRMAIDNSASVREVRETLSVLNKRAAANANMLMSEAKQATPLVEACGQCFDYAMKRALSDNSVTVVHGVVNAPAAQPPHSYIHAWVEKNGMVYDWQTMKAGHGGNYRGKGYPQEVFYELFKPEQLKKYTANEVLAKSVEAGHKGPWLDSVGNTLNKTFMRWFSKSKVITEQGQPKLVYHGGEFNELIDPVMKVRKRKNIHRSPVSSWGVFFAPSDKTADIYAGTGSIFDGKVTEAYLSIQNPYRMDTKEFRELVNWGRLPDQKYKTFRDANKAGKEKLAAIKEAGHDGIFIGDDFTSPDEYVIFESKQAKSSKNAGTFDPASPNILASEDEITYEEFTPEFNAKNLMKILGPALYGDLSLMPLITAKETFQNSVDAIKDNITAGNITSGKVEVITNEADRTITIKDNGIGMDHRIITGPFVSIAESEKGSDDNTGGYGIAKLVFLYGADAIKLRSVRGGNRYHMDSTGAEMLGAFSLGGKKPKIGKETGVDEPSGSELTITIPEFYYDPGSDSDVRIPFPSSSDIRSLPAFERSPIFAPIEVIVDGIPVDAGTRFPKEEYGIFNRINLPGTGHADIYVQKAEERYGMWGDNTHILINGIWQFGTNLKIDPTDSNSRNIPKHIYINIRTSVSPISGSYPIAPNRQGFRPSFTNGFGKLFQQLQLKYGALGDIEHIKSFGAIQTVSNRGTFGKEQQLLPELSKEQLKGMTLEVNPEDEFIIDDNKIYKNKADFDAGVEMPIVDRDELERQKFKLDDYTIPQDTFNPASTYVHNNLLVRMPSQKQQLRQERQVNFERRMELYDMPYEQRDQDELANLETTVGEIDREIDEITNRGEPEEGPKISLPEAGDQKFGPRYGKFLNNIGKHFRDIRDFVVLAEPGRYAGLRAIPTGISFDRPESSTVFGKHVLKPFEMMLVDPGATMVSDLRTHATNVMFTMIHEVAHHKSRSDYGHGEFANEIQHVLQLISMNYRKEYNRLHDNIMKLFEENSDIITFLREVHENETKYSTERIGDSFKNEVVSGAPKTVRRDRDTARDPGRNAGVGRRTESGIPRDDGGESDPDTLDSLNPGGLVGNVSNIADTITTHDYTAQKDNVLYWLQDKTRYLRTRQQVIEKRLGREPGELDPDVPGIPLGQDAYLAETARYGREKNRIEAFQNDVRNPILNLLNENNLTIEKAETFLHARHAVEANERLRKINAKMFLNHNLDNMTREQRVRVKDAISVYKSTHPDAGAYDMPTFYHNLLLRELSQMPQPQQDTWNAFTKKPSGMSDAAARNILSEVPVDSPKWQLGDMFDAMNRESILIRQEAGLISDEETDALLGAYQHWAPLKREGFEDSLKGKGQGSSIGGKEFMTRAGSDKPVKDILSWAIYDAERSIKRSEKQKVGEALYNMVQAYPDSEFWEINKDQPLPRLDADGSIAKYPNTREEDFEIRVKIDGELHTIWFNPANINARRIAYGLKNIDNSSGSVVNFLSWINRWLSFVNTSASPEFMFTNPMRDFMTAQFNLSDTEADGLRGKIVKDYASAMNGIRTALRTDATTPWGEWYKDFDSHGGSTGWVENYGSIDQVKANLKKEMKRMKKGTTRYMVRNIVKAITDYNTVAENAVRLSTYKNLVEARAGDIAAGTVTEADVKKRAAYIAKELTVNFNRKGAAGQLVNSLYLFANANIQGNMRIIRAARYSKKVQVMLGATIGAAVMMSFVNRLVGGDDEDGESMYDKVPKWVKERNMVFMHTDGSYTKVPLPWGYNIFWVLGDQIGDAMAHVAGMNPEYTLGDSSSTMALATLGAFSPIQGGTLLQGISPTITDPFAMIAENKTFTGAPLKPENNEWQKVPAPEHQLYWNSVSDQAKWIAEFASYATGGDEVKGGALDVSPEILDLIWDTTLGSAGRFVSDVGGLAAAPFKQEMPGVKKIPFARRFYGEKNNSVDMQLYRERIKEVWTAEKRYEKLRRDDPTVIDDTRKLRRLAPTVKSTEKQLKQLRKLKKSARNKERKDAIQIRIEKLMARFNGRYRMTLYGG